MYPIQIFLSHTKRYLYCKYRIPIKTFKSQQVLDISLGKRFFNLINSAKKSLAIYFKLYTAVVVHVTIHLLLKFLHGKELSFEVGA